MLETQRDPVSSVLCQLPSPRHVASPFLSQDGNVSHDALSGVKEARCGEAGLSERGIRLSLSDSPALPTVPFYFFAFCFLIKPV